MNWSNTSPKLPRQVSVSCQTGEEFSNDFPSTSTISPLYIPQNRVNNNMNDMPWHYDDMAQTGRHFGDGDSSFYEDSDDCLDEDYDERFHQIFSMSGRGESHPTRSITSNLFSRPRNGKMYRNRFKGPVSDLNPLYNKPKAKQYSRRIFYESGSRVCSSTSVTDLRDHHHHHHRAQPESGLTLRYFLKYTLFLIPVMYILYLIHMAIILHSPDYYY